MHTQVEERGAQLDLSHRWALTLAAPALLPFAGTPLEPSRRRLLQSVSYAYLASLPINVGLLTWVRRWDWAGSGLALAVGPARSPRGLVECVWLEGAENGFGGSLDAI